MITENLPLNYAKLFSFDPFIDSRGSFRRLLCRNELENIGLQKEIVQVNHSITQKKGTVRGMHFQHPPHSEVKLIRCIRGSVYDVIVDIRKGSPTFLKWCSAFLSLENNKGIFIPEGFAHGFQTLEDNTELIYFHTELYNKKSEGALNYSDPVLNITFPLPVTGVSDRDKSHKLIDPSFSGLVV